MTVNANTSPSFILVHDCEQILDVLSNEVIIAAILQAEGKQMFNSPI